VGVQKEFQISFRAGDAAGAFGCDEEAGGASRSADLFDGAAMERGVADDATAADGGALQLELRFHEQENVSARRCKRDEGGDYFGEADEGKVGGDDGGALGEIRGDEVARVLLDGDDARVLAELPGELADGDVHGIDAGGAALEQAISEAAGGGADVEADAACGVDAEVFEGASEFGSGAAGEGRFVAGEFDGGVDGNECACFLGLGAAYADAAGEQQRLRALAGFGEAALDEQQVQTALLDLRLALRDCRSLGAAGDEEVG
jgi:hypothetical protein